MGDTSGAFGAGLGTVYKATETIAHAIQKRGHVQLASATEHPLPDQTASVWFTDPPYYDAIPYSDLSDFFLVWLKRAFPTHSSLRDPFDPDNALSPKTAEAVQDETKQVDGRPKDRTWFEETMSRAFAEGRRVLRTDGVGSVVFAHKTTEGWEALLSGMIRGGWTITASWPIATERPGRLRSQDSAALATSVHLVCRPRPDDAPVGDWADVLHELPVRVADWMERLQGEGIRGADLVFACIGPALEIFSRYRMVETADGRRVGLAEYLERVWEVVGRTALENILGAAEAKARNGLAGALEEDARLTALFLWTLQATASEETADAGPNKTAPGGEAGEEVDDEPTGKAKSYSLVFDVVRRFAQPLGIDLQKWEKRTIETKKGIVRLLPVAERARHLFGDRGGAGRCDVAGAGGRSRNGSAPGHALSRSAGTRVSEGSRAPTSLRPHRREVRRSLHWLSRHDDTRQGPHRDAAPGRRAHPRATGPGKVRAGTGPVLPAPVQRTFRTLSARQRGKAPPRRHATGCTEMKTHAVTAPTDDCVRELRTREWKT